MGLRQWLGCVRVQVARAEAEQLVLLQKRSFSSRPKTVSSPHWVSTATYLPAPETAMSPW